MFRIKLYGFTDEPYTSKTKRNECKEDGCSARRQQTSARCSEHSLGGRPKKKKTVV